MRPIQKGWVFFFEQRCPTYNEVRRLAAFWGIVSWVFYFSAEKVKSVAFFKEFVRINYNINLKGGASWKLQSITGS